MELPPIRGALAQASLKELYFLQNQGFDPETCINNFENAEGKLSTIGLAPPMQALEPLMHKMHIISGLHGLAPTPGHSAYFGALGGYRGGLGVAPSGVTIDYALSQMRIITIMRSPLCLGGIHWMA